MLKIVLALVKNKPILVPTYKLNSVDEMLKVPRLTNEDKKVFIFDKDDTLVSLHQFKVTNRSICNLLSHLKQGGKKVYVVSNSVTNHGHQVTYLDENNIQKTIDILHTKQKKPYNAEQIQQLIESYPENKAQNIKLNWSNTVVVGDRLLTDIVLGNLLGWTTVLVKPIEQTKIGKHGLGVFVMRKIQNLIINIL